MMKNKITIECTVNGSLNEIWQFWTLPKHIEKWNTASEDWYTPKAENNLIVGGKFNYTMSSKDGSFSFDFSGTYTEIIENKTIKYTLDDGRKVEIIFISEKNNIQIIESFEPENENPIEIQQKGWQLILNNFKKYVEEFSNKLS